MSGKISRAYEFFIQNLAGVYLPAGLAGGLGMNGQSFWFAVLASAIYGACIFGGEATSDDPIRQARALRQGIIWGGASLPLAALAYFLVPALVT